MADALNVFRDVLPANGSTMPYGAFIAAARAAGASDRNWLKAKHAGLIESLFDANGVHVVRRVIATPVVV